jgi:hypothetical protein
MLFDARRRCRSFVLGVAVLVLSMHGLAAAPLNQPRESSPADVFTFFYRAPQPERLVGFISNHGKSYRAWNAYPPLVGFFAVVFRAHPDWIDRLVPAECESSSAETIAAALRLAGWPAQVASIQRCLDAAGSDARLKAELANLPSRLDDLQIATPTHLDILWGASFASGDGRYPLMIVDYFARTANRSGPIAADVGKTAVAVAGGPKEVLGQLRGKYGDELAREIIFAAVAAWALHSNARQHPFVDTALASYIREHPGTYATVALSALRPTRP